MLPLMGGDEKIRESTRANTRDVWDDFKGTTVLLIVSLLRAFFLYFYIFTLIVSYA